MSSANVASQQKREDSGSLILIDKASDSELGRLLSVYAKTPFTVPSFPGPMDGEWSCFADAVDALYSDFLQGVNPRREIIAGQEHSAWLNANDEDRIAFILRQKIQCNSYLKDLLSTSSSSFLFVDSEGSVIQRFRWLTKELMHLRRYFRKSYAQGHQQPYVRSGRHRPFIWR